MVRSVVNTEFVIETRGLTKSYGNTLAVKSLDLNVRRGEVYGFLGPNGAGKTTTLRMMLGLIKPSSGNASVLGKSPGESEMLRRVGTLVESAAFYPYMSGRANLRVVARLSGVEDIKNRVGEVLEKVGLSERAKDKYKKYSTGMKQRLGVGAALLKDPELLILDEPTNGLDPRGMADMRELVLTQKPGRLPYFSGKLLSLAIVIVVLTLLSFAAGAICSYVVSTLQDGTLERPSFVERLKALGTGWLILATFAAVGLFLATLFRGSALAIGLGLVYLLVLENLFLGFSAQNDTVETIGRVLPGRNSVDLVSAFSEFQPGTAVGATPPGIEAVGVNQAALVLGAYVVGFVILSVLLFRSRDLS